MSYNWQIQPVYRIMYTFFSHQRRLLLIYRSLFESHCFNFGLAVDICQLYGLADFPFDKREFAAFVKADNVWIVSYSIFFPHVKDKTDTIDPNNINFINCFIFGFMVKHKIDLAITQNNHCTHCHNAAVNKYLTICASILLLWV